MPTLRLAFRIFSDKGARFLGAAVAFYALLSAAPLFVLVLHVVGLVFGRARAESALWSGLGHWLAPEGLAAVRDLTARLDEAQGDRGLVGALLVLYGSTRLFRALRRSVNQLWGIDLEAIERARPRHVKYGVRYGAALLLALFVAAMVSVMIVVKAGFALVSTYGGGASLAGQNALLLLDGLVSIGLAFALFFTLFRALPAVHVSAREAATSALASTLLFALGSALVTAYVRRKHLDDLYEGAGAVVVAVLWVYYSTQVFFFGACLGAAIHGRAPGPIEDERAPPRRGGRSAATRIGITVLVSGVLGWAVAVALRPNFGGEGIRTNRTAAMELRRATEVWRGTHAADACPTLQQLRDDRTVDPASRLKDQWGTPFKIVCTGDETTVISLGPDRRESADDIYVPEPDPSRDGDGLQATPR